MCIRDSLRDMLGNIQAQVVSITHASDTLAASADESGKAAEHIAISVQTVAHGGSDASERMQDVYKRQVLGFRQWQGVGPGAAT